MILSIIILIPDKMIEIVRSQIHQQTHSYQHFPSSPTSPIHNDRNSFKAILKIYFNFTFYLCLSPFRISEISSHTNSMNPQPVKFRIKKFRPQMVICGAIHALLIYNYMVSIRHVKFTKLVNNPVVYFELFHSVTNSIYRISFCLMLWTRQKQLSHVMEFNGDLVTPSPKVVRRIPMLTLFLCVMYTLMSFACGILGDEYASHTSNGSDPLSFSSWNWNPQVYIAAASAKAKYLFFLSNGTTWTERTNDLSLSDSFLGVIGIILSLARNLCTFHSNLFLLLITISLAIHADGLHKLFTTSERIKLGKNISLIEIIPDVKPTLGVIMSKYQGLKKLSFTLNSNFGHLMLLYVLTSIATLATYLDSVIVEPDLFTKIRILWSTNTFMVILTLGSTVVKKVSQLKEWVSRGENCEKIGLAHLISFLDELNDYPIGISGMGMFTIHFKFVTGLASTLVTYFIIMLQFQVAVRETE